MTADAKMAADAKAANDDLAKEYPNGEMPVTKSALMSVNRIIEHLGNWRVLDAIAEAKLLQKFLKEA